MYLTHLSLTNFRNYARLDRDMPRGPLLLVAGNAQGKTSLLEAVYFLATFVSFHATNDRQLINLPASAESLAVARIQAAFQYQQEDESKANSSTHRLEARIIQEENGGNGGLRVRKEILLDGVKRKSSEVIGKFNAVMFLPQMLRIVEGSPEERRRYINLALAQAIPYYAPTLSTYSQVLSQRNALLKQLSERRNDPHSAAAQLGFWDEQLAIAGAHLIYSRIHAIQELERLAAQIHRELTRNQEVMRLVYQPSFEPLPTRPGQYLLPLSTSVDRGGLSIEKIQVSFQDCLFRMRGEEITRGVTTIGPHRDELRFLGNGIDLGIFGSRGQARTAVLALKLAEVVWLKEKTGHWPVLLLDEVLAELDPIRRVDLLSRLLTSEQTLVTTTDLDQFSEEFLRTATIWNIQEGQISEGKA